MSSGNGIVAHSIKSLTEHPSRTLNAEPAPHKEVKREATKVAVENKNEVLSVQVDTEINCNTCCYPENNPTVLFVRIFACLVAGVIFGWALEKGRVFEPEVIRDQMVFRRWLMMKMFLSALATGQICLSLLSVIPRTKDYFERAMVTFGGCFNCKGVLSSSVGPFILGIGMTLAGACPGMVLAQVGSITRNSEYTLCGALAGALLYGLVQPLLVPILSPSSPMKTQTVHEKLKVSYATIGFTMGVSILFVVGLLEAFVPWQTDLPPQRTNGNEGLIFQWVAWPPVITGILIGILQIFIVLAVKDTLGGSSSYQTITSQWLITPSLRKTFSYMASYRCGISNWWQVVYVFGAMLGAMISSVASETVQTTKGVPVGYAVTGGILMVFGARFASGCTSGHGISGAALLYWLSWIAVPCMFAGAISTAILLQAVGQLDVYDCSGLNIPCNL